MFAALLLGLFVFDTANTAFRMTYDAYLLLVAPRREDRTQISMITSYVCMVPAFLGTAVTVTFLTGGYPRWVVMAMFAAISVVGALLFFLGTLAMKDSPRLYETKMVDEERATFENKGTGVAAIVGILCDIRDILKNRAFLTFVLFSIFASGIGGMYMNPYGYYMQHVLDAGGLMATLPDIAGGVVQVVMYPFLAHMMRRMGVRKMLLVMIWPSIISYVGLYFAQAYWQGFLFYTTLMIGFSAFYISGMQMFGCIIDDDEKRNGTRRAGMFMGLRALVTIPASALHLTLFATVLQRYGYDGAVTRQSQQAIEGIRIGTALVPIVSLLVGVVALFLYPVDLKAEKELSLFSQSRRSGLS